MFATNAELAELQSTHKTAMKKHEMELAKIQGTLKERTKACRQAREACPRMLVEIESLRSENARQAAEIKELRVDNETLSRLSHSFLSLDEKSLGLTDKAESMELSQWIENVRLPGLLFCLLSWWPFFIKLIISCLIIID
jgi:hypothetical protein